MSAMQRKRLRQQKEELVAQAITEAVCRQFMDWLGEKRVSLKQKLEIKAAPMGLKEDVFLVVKRILAEGIEI